MPLLLACCFEAGTLSENLRVYDLRPSWQLNAINSSQATSHINMEQKSNVSEALSATIIAP
jgi:hypothetical protein